MFFFFSWRSWHAIFGPQYVLPVEYDHFLSVIWDTLGVLAMGVAGFVSQGSSWRIVSPVKQIKHIFNLEAMIFCHLNKHTLSKPRCKSDPVMFVSGLHLFHYTICLQNQHAKIPARFAIFPQLSSLDMNFQLEQFWWLHHGEHWTRWSKKKLSQNILNPDKSYAIQTYKR